MKGQIKTAAGWFVVAFVSIAPLGGAANDARVAEAVKRRDGQALRTLLKQRVDVNTLLPDGATALHWASQWEELEIVDLLITAGARVNAADDYGVTPLWLACTNGNATIVEKLLQAGADSTATLPSGETVLMTAAHTGNTDVVNLLMGHGANVNAKQKASGHTALMWAAAEGHSDVAQRLIKYGADVQARSRTGFTAFLLSARTGVLGCTQGSA